MDISRADVQIKIVRFCYYTHGRYTEFHYVDIARQVPEECQYVYVLYWNIGLNCVIDSQG